MLIDLRIYTFHPGKLAPFLKLSQEQILPLQTRYCGTCIFYSTTETGTLNQLVQAWAYRDAADRDARRAAPRCGPTPNGSAWASWPCPGSRTRRTGCSSPPRSRRAPGPKGCEPGPVI